MIYELHCYCLRKAREKGLKDSMPGLTGKYRSESDFAKSKRGDRVKHYLNERGLRILAALDKIGKDYRAMPASEHALAWLMTRPTRRPLRVDQLGAAEGTFGSGALEARCQRDSLFE